jgi:hypothetical protein
MEHSSWAGAIALGVWASLPSQSGRWAITGLQELANIAIALSHPPEQWPPLLPHSAKDGASAYLVFPQRGMALPARLFIVSAL